MPSIIGQVYDIDYIQNANWCQIIIRDGFVGFVREASLQGLLEAAMRISEPVTVHYYDDDQSKRIVRALLRRQSTTTAPNGFHYVIGLDMDESDGKCKATVMGSDEREVSVFTRDARMQSLLVTAIREGWMIGELSFEPTSKELTRGKLNVEDQRL